MGDHHTSLFSDRFRAHVSFTSDPKVRACPVIFLDKMLTDKNRLINIGKHFLLILLTISEIIFKGISGGKKTVVESSYFLEEKNEASKDGIGRELNLKRL